MPPSPFNYEQIAVDVITVDTHLRHRADFGDLKAFAQNIEKYGQLQPIGITEELKLVYGERRLRAIQLLGWTKIWACIGPYENLLELELAENFERKDFTPSEMVSIGRAIEQKERAKAADRQSRKGQAREEKAPDAEKGRTADRVARLFGVSGNTYTKAKKVVEAAEADAKHQPLVEQIDRTGKVNAAFNKLTKSKDEERVLNLKPVEGKFRTLIMDCPWEQDWLSESAQAALKYATMTLDEIAAINPRQWIDLKNGGFGHLYMWAPNNFVIKAGNILEYWGFDYKGLLTWDKQKFGHGSYFRNQTEQVLFATIGKTMTTRVNDIGTLFSELAQGEHSQKPPSFHDIVARASYPPYGEAFQRTPVEGFTNLYEEKTKKASAA